MAASKGTCKHSDTECEAIMLGKVSLPTSESFPSICNNPQN